MLVLWLQFQNHRYAAWLRKLPLVFFSALKVCFLSQVTSIEAVVVDGMLET
jgi:hypothetical protein